MIDDYQFLGKKEKEKENRRNEKKTIKLSFNFCISVGS
jgi:hypothetical protein